MTSARDVSLYIPASRCARTLPAAIESVRRQTAQPARFFVVVDARGDEETLRAARSSGVEVIEQHDGRLGFARNLAIQDCRTTWLASCDADVTLEPTWLEALLAAAEPGLGAVGGRTEEAPFTPADRWRAVNMPHNWGPAGFDNPFMLVSEMMARADVLRRVGGYVADLRYGEDSDLCQRIRHAGYTLRYVPGAVAWHDRRDSVQSVLNLRWAYSYNRQRTRLESLPGLVSKLPTNRVYTLQSLSQTLHSEHASTCGLSLLIWFHHAEKDLRAALERWPLLDTEARNAAVAALWRGASAALDARWAGVLAPVRRLLSFGQGDCAGGELLSAPGFADYVQLVANATRALLAEIPSELCPFLQDSLSWLAAPAPAEAPAAPTITAAPDDEAKLAAQPLRPAWNAATLCQSLHEAGLVGHGDDAAMRALLDDARVVGRSLPEESGSIPTTKDRSSVAHSGEAPPGGTLLIPHLESFADPVAALRVALRSARAALIAYQAPSVFLPAVPFLSARDLARVAAGEGFAIRHFYTEAGLTRLLLERPQVSGGDTRSHTHRRAPSMPADASV